MKQIASIKRSFGFDTFLYTIQHISSLSFASPYQLDNNKQLYKIKILLSLSTTAQCTYPVIATSSPSFLRVL